MPSFDDHMQLGLIGLSMCSLSVVVAVDVCMCVDLGAFVCNTGHREEHT